MKGESLVSASAIASSPYLFRWGESAGAMSTALHMLFNSGDTSEIKCRCHTGHPKFELIMLIFTIGFFGAGTANAITHQETIPVLTTNRFSGER